MNEEEERQARVAEFSRIKNTWLRMYIRFIWAHYLMSGLAIVLSIIVGFLKSTPEHPTAVPVLGVILAIDTGLVAFLGAEKKANQAQRAWRILNVAISRYIYGKSFSYEDVLKAYEIGEDILHETQTAQGSFTQLHGPNTAAARTP